MYSGKTPLGHDFGDLYTATRWKEQVIAPLHCEVYPHEFGGQSLERGGMLIYSGRRGHVKPN